MAGHLTPDRGEWCPERSITRKQVEGHQTPFPADTALRLGKPASSEGCLTEATRGRRQAGALRRRTARQASAIALVLTIPIGRGSRAPRAAVAARRPLR